MNQMLQFQHRQCFVALVVAGDCRCHECFTQTVTGKSRVKFFPHGILARNTILPSGGFSRYSRLSRACLVVVASTGEMVQEKLTGQTVIEQLTSGHISPFGDGQGAF